MRFNYEVATKFKNGDWLVRPFKFGMFANVYAKQMRRKNNVDEVTVNMHFRQKGEQYEALFNSCLFRL